MRHQGRLPIGPFPDGRWLRRWVNDSTRKGKIARFSRLVQSPRILAILHGARRRPYAVDPVLDNRRDSRGQGRRVREGGACLAKPSHAPPVSAHSTTTGHGGLIRGTIGPTVQAMGSGGGLGSVRSGSGLGPNPLNTPWPPRTPGGRGLPQGRSAPRCASMAAGLQRWQILPSASLVSTAPSTRFSPRKPNK